VLLSLLASGTSAWFTYHDLLQRAHDDLAAVGRAKSGVLALLVSNGQEDFIQQHLLTMVRSTPVHRAQIRIQGKERWSAGQASEDRLLIERFVIADDAQSSSGSAGVLELAMSVEQIHADLRERIGTSLIVSLSLGLTLALIILILVRHRVSLPLQRLRVYLQGLEALRPNAPASRSFGHDDPVQVIELDRVAEAINDMVHRLALSHDALEKNIQSRNHELEIALREREKNQAEIEALNALLSQRLDQQNFQLQGVHEDLESFAYSVSHDLRAPLQAIDGFLGIILEEYGPQLDAEGQRMMKVVRDNANEINELIDSILEYSRAGRLQQEHVDIDMQRLVDEVWRDLQTDVRFSGEFVCRELPSTHGDPQALRLVWKALLSNAVKFSAGAASPLIEVFAESEPRVTRYSVRDNGVGFSMDYRGKLFRLFQRLHGKADFAGRGVELAIVKRFIEKHGGSVDAQGELDKGAVFSFSLPLHAQVDSTHKESDQ
jgi:signal transduction histidine kinase